MLNYFFILSSFPYFAIALAVDQYFYFATSPEIFCLDGALQDVIQKNIELNKGWDDVQEEEQAREQGAAAVEKPNLAYVKPAIPIANNSATDQSAQNGKKDHQKVTFNAATGHQAVSSTSTWHPPVASTPQKMREGVESETACNLSPIVCGVSLNVRESVVVPKEVSEKFTMTKEAPLQRNGNATVDGCDAQTGNLFVYFFGLMKFLYRDLEDTHPRFIDVS